MCEEQVINESIVVAVTKLKNEEFTIGHQEHMLMRPAEIQAWSGGLKFGEFPLYQIIGR